MSLAEDSYGRVKRLEFIGETIHRLKPRQVLDIGCGAGTQLTFPLATAFPEVEILGTDEDESSLDWARRHAPAPNLRFLAPGELPPDRRFDLVIASEVLEHVIDPPGFLDQLRARLAPAARLIITVPNGYGVFEAMALVEALLHLSGLQGVLRRLKPARRPRENAVPTTLAISPHVNFFSFREIGRLFAAAGLAVERYRPRTVLCGYLVDDLLRGRKLLALNARLAERLPPCGVSDWMFELKPAERVAEARAWRRGRWAAWRKRVNERRWAHA
jgi:SAM-dependent methyltransferase